MAQDHHTLSDTLGRNVAGSVWITLRPDTPGGISLGGDRGIGPGETGLVPRALADRLVRNGKASYADAPQRATPAPALAPEVIQTPDPVPATREPEPLVQTKPAGKRRR